MLLRLAEAVREAGCVAVAAPGEASASFIAGLNWLIEVLVMSVSVATRVVGVAHRAFIMLAKPSETGG
jgi:hypothetical protein